MIYQDRRNQFRNEEGTTGNMVGQEYVLNIFGAFWSTDWGMKILSLPSNLGASSFLSFL